MADRAAASAAGVSGVVFTARASGGTGAVRVGVDYASFAQAYGGNYTSRLRLVRLPACALTTPEVATCRTQSPLASTNDTATGSVSAQVEFGSPVAASHNSSSAASAAMVLAATADPGQGGAAGGTYAATSLKPSGSWTAGGSTGSFDYSYPITVPPAASSLVPKVELSYDSGSVDGQTASTQAQSSWVGDGWSTPQSYIEQSFISCADNPEGIAAPVSTGDMCYDGPILTMSLSGSSTSLVWDTARSVWKPQHDNGEVVTHVTNSGNGTLSYNTDYWTVTDRSGTSYTFGLNRLPGWSAGGLTTNSVDTEPVYSAHPGDPCYNPSGFSASVCTMAYRWNLDYVKDVHGNAMAYYYGQDTNSYGQYNGASNTSYVRDSHLDHIDYGFTDGNAYGTVPDRVTFNTAARCLSGSCTPLNSSTKANWPDVPYDLSCTSGATCTSNSPSFYSTVRLTSIVTSQYTIQPGQSSGTYLPLDTYTLAQSFPSTGDGTSPTLWLDSLTHTASATTGGGSTAAITLPAVVFGKTQEPNRRDLSTGLPAFYRYRLSSITTETGSVITVTYDLANPCSTPVGINPASNTSSCYPVSWTPPGLSDPKLDWFNKYVVTNVTATANSAGIDPTRGMPSTSTSYIYKGGAAWHYDDNELIKPKYRTYGQFRGYGDVQTLTGDGAQDPQTLSETTYYRGMSNNNNAVAVTLTDSQGGQHDDANQLAGSALESTTYLGNGGPIDHSTITSYWVSAPTATRNRSGLPALTATWVAPAETYTRQALTDAGTTTWRTTETDTSHDPSTSSPTFGLATAVYTHTVPADPAYDSCAATSYAPANTGVNLVGLVAEAETDSVACDGFTQGNPASAPATLNALTPPSNVDRPNHVTSDTRTFYDDPTFSVTFPQSTAPSRGEATMVRKAVTWAGGAFTYQTTVRTAYDSYGRPTSVWDGNGNQTLASYAMNGAGLTTGKTVTNPLGQTTTTTVETQRNLTVGTSDINGVTTINQYDALGRVTAVWLDSRGVKLPANYLYSYQVSAALTAVTTLKMKDSGSYQTATTIYDAQLRPRQTQADTPLGGRMVTDTFYDSHGWTAAKYNGWWDAGTFPNTTLVAATGNIPSQDFYTYDGLGRVVVDTSEDNRVTKETTTTVYNGDRTTVIPPAGGIIQATVTDPLGRTSELDQYTSPPTLNTPANTFNGLWSVSGGASTVTRYGYDSHGNQATVTDAGGSTWTSTYNLLGQVVAKADPDAGASTLNYDGNGNLTQTTDSRGKTISTTYDPLGRKTGLYDAPSSGQNGSNLLASWVYDNANNAVAGMKFPLGHLTTSTAYWNGAAYTTQYNNFNVFGESLGETVTIPAVEGQLAGPYTYRHIYTPRLGLPGVDVYPAGGGLPDETVSYSYTTRLDLIGTVGGFNGYQDGTTYDEHGRVIKETLNPSPNHSYVINVYDRHTGRLTEQQVQRQVATPTVVDDEQYRYDQAGNVTKRFSTRLGDSSPTETQCYTYDTLDRLAAAWTATDSCDATPTTDDHTTVGDNLGSDSAYWTTWTFDPLGNRTNQTQHAIISGSDTTTTYAYNGNGGQQPHTLTSTGTTGAATGSTSYAYDAAGNMTGRNAAQGNQTLNWDDAGRLISVTGSNAGPTGYLYGADGNLLLEKNPGSTTLYLPHEQIVLDTTTGATTGTRYFPLPGGTTAIRTGTDPGAHQYEITDQHATPVLYLDGTAQVPTWRQYTPYGAPRGTTSPWPDNHGFLNKPTNTATGLTEVGARNYDPDTGRFISDDPILEKNDAQQLNGYTYSANNPTTLADPTGLEHGEETGNECTISCGINPGSGDVENISDPVRSANHDGEFHGDAGHGKSPVTPSYTINAKNIANGGIKPEQLLRDANNDPDPHWIINGHNYSRDQLLDQLAGMGGPDQDYDLCGTQGTCEMTLIFPQGGHPCGYDASQAWCNYANTMGTEVGWLTLADGAGGPRPGGRAGCSFDGDTPVLMADGTAKAIKSVKVGDLVQATDPTTQTTANEAVLLPHLNLDTQLTDLIVETQGHLNILHTTQNHPFWDATTHQWTAAGNLRPGHTLATANGSPARVASVTNFTGHQAMYNLTINHTHTYYVIAGTTPVLVHNTPGCGPDIAGDLGGLPTGRQPHVRTVGTEDDLQGLYNKWSEGGTDITPNGYNGKMVQLPDGTIVGLRNASKSGGATIDIKLPDGTVQKVHVDGP